LHGFKTDSPDLCLEIELSNRATNHGNSRGVWRRTKVCRRGVFVGLIVTGSQT
jgi:hypothetical protein